MTLSVEAIVEAGLCIGCGLCQAVAGPRHIRWVMTPEGRERPVVETPLTADTLRRINEVCPGTKVSGAAPASSSPHASLDAIWGPAERLAIGFAADAAVRHQASSGGILTALGQFLIDSGRVDFVLQVGAAAAAPMRSERRLSFDAISVLDGAGSRYGPAAPLVDFTDVLDRGRPFALIAKPCDITAVRNFAALDPRVDELMRYALTFVCGGASELAKSTEVLAGFGLAEREVALFRYRGFGSPGPTRIETRDGRAFEISYQRMWEVESTWRIQSRCKICPDALGEGADIVASDVWEGGGPRGEGEGFNGIIVRTRAGVELYEAALAAGAIRVQEQTPTFRDFDRYQPHQVRKKRAVWARLAGISAAGQPVPRVDDLRLRECASQNTWRENLQEARGANKRARSGRFGEPPAVSEAAPVGRPPPADNRERAPDP